MSIEKPEKNLSLEEAEQKIAELESKIQELELQNQELEREAFLDHLTQLPNRRGMEELAKVLLPEKRTEAHERRLSEEKQKDIAILVLDIDNFKIVNDAFGGHEAGDKVLEEGGQFLRSKVRGNDILARIGGEEFAIIFHDLDEQGVIRKFFDTKEGRARLGFTTKLEGEETPINFSGGVTMLKAGETIEDLWKIVGRADKALYQAKEDEKIDNGEVKVRGRDRILIFNGDEAQK